jgi:hypothetical protein
MKPGGWGPTLLGAVAAMAWLGGPLPLLPELHASPVTVPDPAEAAVRPAPARRFAPALAGPATGTVAG